MTDKDSTNTKGKAENIILDAEEAPQGVPSRFEFSRPTRQQLSRSFRGGDVLNGQYNLALDCAVTPSREELGLLFSEWPGLAVSIGGALFKAVGGGLDFTPAKR